MTAPENFLFEEPEKGLAVEKLRARIQKFAKMSAEGVNTFLVVELRGRNELIGYGGYNTFDSVDPTEFLDQTTLPGSETHMTDIGIIIDHKHWRKGYGLESISIEYAQNNLGCEVFRAETGNDNEPWRALMRAVWVLPSLKDDTKQVMTRSRRFRYGNSMQDIGGRRKQSCKLRESGHSRSFFFLQASESSIRWFYLPSDLQNHSSKITQTTSPAIDMFAANPFKRPVLTSRSIMTARPSCCKPTAT